MKEGDNAPSDLRGKHDNRPHSTPQTTKDAIRDHIRTFPTYESHYTRNQHPNLRYLEPGMTVMDMFRLFVHEQAEKGEPSCHEWLYQHVFNTEFKHLK